MPCSPSDVGILLLNGLPSGSWATTAKFPRWGMRNLGNTCYVNSVAQVLMRTPAMCEWMCRHNADGCPHSDTGCVLCALFRTYGQLLRGGAGDALRCRPVLAEQRGEVGEVFRDNNQHDVFEFFESFIDRARAREIEAGRHGPWDGVQLTYRVATHVDRVFGFVQETRRRCKECRGQVQSWFSSECVLRVPPTEMPGGPLTVSEMYFASCAPEEQERFCSRCGKTQLRTARPACLRRPMFLWCRSVVLLACGFQWRSRSNWIYRVCRRWSLLVLCITTVRVWTADIICA